MFWSRNVVICIIASVYRNGGKKNLDLNSNWNWHFRWISMWISFNSFLHFWCCSQYSSKTCAECRNDITVTKKVFLCSVNVENPPVPISDETLMKANTNLLDQLTEHAEEIDNLVASCSALEFQICSMHKDYNDKKAKIQYMEKVVAARNKTITSKEQGIRLLQTQVKDLKMENGTLKKCNHNLATQLKDQKAVEAKMNNIMAENQRLRHLFETKPASNVNSSGDKSHNKKATK